MKTSKPPSPTLTPPIPNTRPLRPCTKHAITTLVATLLLLLFSTLPLPLSLFREWGCVSLLNRGSECPTTFPSSPPPFASSTPTSSRTPTSSLKDAYKTQLDQLGRKLEGTKKADYLVGELPFAKDEEPVVESYAGYIRVRAFPDGWTKPESFGGKEGEGREGEE
ncbi:hypothetical protein HK102_003358, partial [Quaeritorhiza haematococci]